MDSLELVDKLREDALYQIRDIPALAITEEQEIYMEGVAEGLRQVADCRLLL